MVRVTQKRYFLNRACSCHWHGSARFTRGANGRRSRLDFGGNQARQRPSRCCLEKCSRWRMETASPECGAGVRRIGMDAPIERQGHFYKFIFRANYCVARCSQGYWGQNPNSQSLRLARRARCDLPQRNWCLTPITHCR